jgi:hypothetical protein
MYKDSRCSSCSCSQSSSHIWPGMGALTLHSSGFNCGQAVYLVLCGIVPKSNIEDTRIRVVLYVLTPRAPNLEFKSEITVIGNGFGGTHH